MLFMIDEEIQAKLGAIDLVLQKAMGVQPGMNNTEIPRPAQKKEPTKNTQIKRTRSVVGKRDQRFAFNSKNK